MPRSLPIGVAAAVLTTAAVSTAQPRISNGPVTTRPAGTQLAQSFQSIVAQQADMAWIGYSVPVVAGERHMCCGGSGTVWMSGSVIVSDGTACCAACRIEPSSQTTSSTVQSQLPAGPVRLEASTRMAILFRVVNQSVERVRVFSEDCELDAGGRSVTWLEGVRPADSLALLESMAVSRAADRPDRISDGAVAAIALHADEGADTALERLVAANQPEALRRKVPFWLGNARGARGLQALRRILRDDPSLEVRKKAVFGLSQATGDAAVTDLIETGRTNPDAAVRGEAIFWLAQKAGAKAAAEIGERVEQDPDTEVKKRAVFALSQLPRGEGVPRLIEVAKTNPNPAVRKQAMFWLGQSRDPRALDFFAQILK